MTIIGTHAERKHLGGGRYRLTLHPKCIAFRDDQGKLCRNECDWEDSGIPGRPHIVTKAPFMVSVADDGMRRIHPTRENDRYFEIGAPYVKIGGVWEQVGFSGASCQGNRITWSKPQADLSVTMGGHFIKMEIELKGGYVPPDGGFAFPVGLTGLTRSGGQIKADGVTVMRLRKPNVYDADNPMDVRPVAHRFMQIGGQWYVLFTLPDLAGMARPVVDPTLELQPDATAGIDTWLSGYSGAEDSSSGISVNLMIGELDGYVGYITRALIKFDLSSLPTDAVISSATLSLYCGEDYSTNVRTFRVYRQKRAWVEGVNEEPSTSGATWNNYEAAGPTAWQTAGGFGADDCEQTDIGTREFGAAEATGEFKDFSLTPITKAGLDLGNGWMVKADTETDDGYKFDSSDSVTEARRPKLVIEYTADIEVAASGRAESEGSIAGILELLANASGLTTTTATANAVLALLVSALGQAASLGEATACIGLPVSAEGQAISSGEASALLALIGQAEGQEISEGTVYALLALAAAASGQATFPGEARGVLELLANAVGVAITTGEAAVTLNIPAAASGQMISEGNAAGILELLANAVGTAITTGAATVVLDIPVTASGTMISSGEAAALLALIVAASGAEASSGEAAALLELIAAAVGQAESEGAAAALLELIAAAEGLATTTGMVIIMPPFFEGDLGPGETIVIDGAYQTVTIDGVNALKDFVGEFFDLPPGTSIVEYTDLEGSRNLTVTITFKDKWL